MINILSEVAAHKSEYQEIYDMLERKESVLPGLGFALQEVRNVLNRIKWFDEWGIDTPWDVGLRGRHRSHYFNTIRVREIPNQPGGSIYPNEDMLVIDHPTGGHMFSCGDHDYPREFFEQFIDEVRTICPPDYEDKLNDTLYYRKSRAKEAYESYNKVLDKYHEMNKERFKKWQIERLEKELKKAKGE